MDPQARAPAKPEDGGLERRRGTQVPLRAETFRVLVPFLVHVHRPDIRKNDGPFRDAVTFEERGSTPHTLRGSERYRHVSPWTTSSSTRRCAIPSGVGGWKRSDSLMVASRYGSEARSSNVGNRLRPTTASSSACTRFCTSGKSTIVRRNVVMLDVVFEREVSLLQC